MLPIIASIGVAVAARVITGVAEKVATALFSKPESTTHFHSLLDANMNATAAAPKVSAAGMSVPLPAAPVDLAWLTSPSAVPGPAPHPAAVRARAVAEP